MNIRHFTICFSLILLTSLFVGCTGPITKNNEDTHKQSPPSETGTTTETAQTLTKEDALNIALSNAGFFTDQVKFLQAEYGWDNGIPHYEVEFHKDKIQYDYIIHAKTGEILHTEKDWDD